MANFDSATQKADSIREANNLLAHLRGIYQSCKAAQTTMQRYQANTDPVMNGAINAMYNAAERAEMGQMLNQVNSLVTDWEGNHAGAIGII
jgi:hypothetical protein